MAGPGADSAPIRWLLLIPQIPPRPNYLRVKMGRRLQQLGAAAIKNSVYAPTSSTSRRRRASCSAPNAGARSTTRGERARIGTHAVAPTSVGDLGNRLLRANGSQAADAVLAEITERLKPPTESPPPDPSKAITARDVRHRTWLTRKGVHVDRMASAWLIRRFIDPEASFKFVSY
jgi:ChrB, C-terminal domain